MKVNIFVKKVYKERKVRSSTGNYITVSSEHVVIICRCKYDCVTEFDNNVHYTASETQCHWFPSFFLSFLIVTISCNLGLNYYSSRNVILKWKFYTSQRVSCTPYIMTSIRDNYLYTFYVRRCYRLLDPCDGTGARVFGTIRL